MALWITASLVDAESFSRIADLLIWSTVFGLMFSFGGGVNTQAVLRVNPCGTHSNFSFRVTIINALVIINEIQFPSEYSFYLITLIAGINLSKIQLILAAERNQGYVGKADVAESLMAIFSVLVAVSFDFCQSSLSLGYLVGTLIGSWLVSLCTANPSLTESNLGFNSRRIDPARHFAGILLVLYGNVDLLLLTTDAVDYDSQTKVTLFFALKICFAYISLYGGISTFLINNMSEKKIENSLSNAVVYINSLSLIAVLFFLLFSELNSSPLIHPSLKLVNTPFYLALACLTFIGVIFGPTMALLINYSNLSPNSFVIFLTFIIFAKIIAVLIAGSHFGMWYGISLSCFISFGIVPLGAGIFLLRNSPLRYGYVGLYFNKWK